MEPSTEDFQKKLEVLLPAKILKALLLYDDFSSKEIPSDVKAFTAYQQACRSVLSHIFLLLKMMESFKKTSSSDEVADFWIKQAQMKDFENDETDSQFEPIYLDLE